MAKNNINPNYGKYLLYIVFLALAFVLFLSYYGLQLQYYLMIIMRILCLIGIILSLFLIYFANDDEIEETKKSFRFIEA
jgi:Mn2+/Fe2+ NRAMP family transporter